MLTAGYGSTTSVNTTESFWMERVGSLSPPGVAVEDDELIDSKQIEVQRGRGGDSCDPPESRRWCR